MLGMLYLIIGFGVLGTLIMMTTERRKEFGVMIAIGMQKKKLGLIVSIEMLMMGVVGAIAGVIGSLPVIAYLVKNPIRFTGESAKMFEIPACLYRHYLEDVQVCPFFLVLIIRY